MLPGKRGVDLRQAVVLQDRRCLRRRNPVSQCGEVAVAGVSERLLRGEGDVTLGMGAVQVPLLGSFGDAQIAAAKDGGIR